MENELAHLYFTTPPLRTPVRPLTGQDSPESELEVTIPKAYNGKAVEPMLYMLKWVPHPLIGKEKVEVIQSIISNIPVTH